MGIILIQHSTLSGQFSTSFLPSVSKSQIIKHHQCIILPHFHRSFIFSPMENRDSHEFDFLSFSFSLRRVRARVISRAEITLINPPNPLHLVAFTPRLEEPRVIRAIDSKDLLLIPFARSPSPIHRLPVHLSLKQPCNLWLRINSRVGKANNTNLLPLHRMHVKVRPS